MAIQFHAHIQLHQCCISSDRLTATLLTFVKENEKHLTRTLARAQLAAAKQLEPQRWLSLLST